MPAGSGALGVPFPSGSHTPSRISPPARPVMGSLHLPMARDAKGSVGYRAWADSDRLRLACIFRFICIVRERRSVEGRSRSAGHRCRAERRTCEHGSDRSQSSPIPNCGRVQRPRSSADLAPTRARSADKPDPVRVGGGLGASKAPEEPNTSADPPGSREAGTAPSRVV
jgi:hypothetical protein